MCGNRNARLNRRDALEQIVDELNPRYFDSRGNPPEEHVLDRLYYQACVGCGRASNDPLCKCSDGLRGSGVYASIAVSLHDFWPSHGAVQRWPHDGQANLMTVGLRNSNEPDRLPAGRTDNACSEREASPQPAMAQLTPIARVSVSSSCGPQLTLRIRANVRNDNDLWRLTANPSARSSNKPNTLWCLELTCWPNWSTRGRAVHQTMRIIERLRGAKNWRRGRTVQRPESECLG